MKTVLVTGASGFVGQHVCSTLSKVYSVRATYRSEQPPVGMPDAITWIRVEDIGPNTHWAPAIEGVDAVVHLAALAHLAQTDNDAPQEAYFSVNSGGTESLAKALRAQARPARLVFISSIGVICSQSDIPVNEATACRPDSPYGQSKLEAEGILARALAEGSVDWVTLRPPLIYGPGNPGNMARLATLAKLPLPLPIGGFKNQRNFIGVANLVSAIEVALECQAASRKVFCVADDEVVSTPELVQLVAKMMGKEVRLLPFPMPLLKFMACCGDVVRKVTGRSPGWDSYVLDRLAGSLAVDATAFKEATGWRPPKRLADGMREAFHDS